MENGNRQWGKGGDCTQNEVRCVNVVGKVYDEIDKFAQELQDGKIGFKDEAKNLQVYESFRGRLGQTKKQEKGEFLNFLGTAITNYKTAINPILKWEFAQDCLRYIQWARSWDVIIRIDADKKMKSLEEEN